MIKREDDMKTELNKGERKKLYLQKKRFKKEFEKMDQETVLKVNKNSRVISKKGKNGEEIPIMTIPGDFELKSLEIIRTMSFEEIYKQIFDPFSIWAEKEKMERREKRMEKMVQMTERNTGRRF